MQNVTDYSCEVDNRLRALHHQLCVEGLRCPACRGEGSFIPMPPEDQYACPVCHGRGRVRYDRPTDAMESRSDVSGRLTLDLMPVLITWDGMGGALPWLCGLLNIRWTYYGSELVWGVIPRELFIEAYDPLTLAERIIDWWEMQLCDVGALKKRVERLENELKQVTTTVLTPLAAADVAAAADRVRGIATEIEQLWAKRAHPAMRYVEWQADETDTVDLWIVYDALTAAIAHVATLKEALETGA